MTDNELAPRGKAELERFDDMREIDEQVLTAAREAIERGRRSSSKAVHSAMVDTYWTIGKEVTEAVGERAAYGKHLIAFLSERLTAEYGKGFSARTLREARQFYCTFPIWRTVCAKLSWSHYRRNTSLICQLRMSLKLCSSAIELNLRSVQYGSCQRAMLQN